MVLSKDKNRKLRKINPPSVPSRNKKKNKKRYKKRKPLTFNNSRDNDLDEEHKGEKFQTRADILQTRIQP